MQLFKLNRHVVKILHTLNRHVIKILHTLNILLDRTVSLKSEFLLVFGLVAINSLIFSPERWRPFYASTEQLCDLDSRAINFTFDLAPSGCGIQEYFVFLYKTGRNNTCPSSTGPEDTEIVNMVFCCFN